MSDYSDDAGQAPGSPTDSAEGAVLRPRFGTRPVPVRRAAGPEPERSERSLSVLVPSGAPEEAKSSALMDAEAATRTLIAVLINEPADTVAKQCSALARELTAPTNQGIVDAMSAMGNATHYLRGLRLASPWAVIGTNYDTGVGSVDVAYEDGDTGAVVFDIVKVTQAPLRTLPKEWVDESTAQLVAGRNRFGENFVKVRLLTFGAPDLMTAFLPTGETVEIDTYGDPDI